MVSPHVSLSPYACAESAATNEITTFSCCSADSTSCLIRFTRDSVLLRLNISIIFLFWLVVRVSVVFQMFGFLCCNQQMIYVSFLTGALVAERTVPV